MGFAEFIIGPAEGRTRWLNPSYADWFHRIEAKGGEGNGVAPLPSATLTAPVTPAACLFR
jgi:hypothetical protein